MTSTSSAVCFFLCWSTAITAKQGMSRLAWVCMSGFKTCAIWCSRVHAGACFCARLWFYSLLNCMQKYVPRPFALSASNRKQMVETQTKCKQSHINLNRIKDSSSLNGSKRSIEEVFRSFLWYYIIRHRGLEPTSTVTVHPVSGWPYHLCRSSVVGLTQGERESCSLSRPI